MNLARLKSLILRLTERAQEAGKLKPRLNLSVVLAGHAEIKALNRAFLGRDESTDVLAFRFARLPGEADCLSAEIVINADEAVESGSKRGGGWTPSRELALYAAHGLDHIAGGRDGTPAGARRMRRRELAWLRRADRAGLVHGLVRPEARPRGQTGGGGL